MYIDMNDTGQAFIDATKAVVDQVIRGWAFRLEEEFRLQQIKQELDEWINS